MLFSWDAVGRFPSAEEGTWIKVIMRKKALITYGSPVKAMRCIRRNWTVNERGRPSARNASLYVVPWPSNGDDVLDTTLSSTGLFLWLIPATVENMEDIRSREVWLKLEVWIQILKSELQGQTSKHVSTKLMVSQFSEIQSARKSQMKYLLAASSQHL